MQILIAEDDEGSRLILEAAVAELGHTFVSVSDGEEGWRVFQAKKIDAVISDRSMPGIDGLELCRRIRNAPAAAYPYFIFLTALNDRRRILDGMKAGADDYLSKPLDPDELSARLVVAARITELYNRLKDQQSEMAMLNQKLFEQARIDPLTQLGSRLKLSEDLEALMSTGNRYCAVMCDVDHFKLYNDTYGHIAGDEVLQSVARALAAGCRGEDQIYRYGGEEFLILLSSESLEDGERSAERHRAAVERLNIPHVASAFGKVTVSLGVSVLARNTEKAVAAWLGEADAALYRAKGLGRNCVKG